MSDEELLHSVQAMRTTDQGLYALRTAVAEASATGFLNHSSASDTTLAYFSALRHEVHDLLCPSSKRYVEQRRQLERTGIALVGFLTGTITVNLGAPIAVAAPLAAVALFLPLKLGVSAWCKIYEASPNEVTPSELAAGKNFKPKKRG